MLGFPSRGSSVLRHNQTKRAFPFRSAGDALAGAKITAEAAAKAVAAQQYYGVRMNAAGAQILLPCGLSELCEAMPPRLSPARKSGSAAGHLMWQAGAPMPLLVHPLARSSREGCQDLPRMPDR